MKKFIYTAFLMYSVALQAQDISGTVYGTAEKNKKEPLPGVNLYWEGTQSGTVTDVEGRYTLPRAQGSQNRLVASFIGFQNDTILVDDRQKKLDIVLSNGFNFFHEHIL